MADVPQNAPEHCPGTSSSSAGAASACAGCPNQTICASGQAAAPDPDVAAIRERMSAVRHKLLLLSGKGGVGKTTATAMLARALAADPNTQVGVLDVDVCGPSQPRVMGTAGHSIHTAATGWSPVWVEDNLCVMSTGYLLESTADALLWRGPNKNGLIKRFLKDVDWGSLDYLVIDTPPGTSDEHLTLVHYLLDTPGTAALVVTTPQEISLLDVRKELTFCERVKLPVIGIVENMTSFVCPNCKHESSIFPASGGGAAGLATDTGLAVVARLPLDPRLARACDEGTHFLADHATTPAAIAYNSLANKVREYFGDSVAAEERQDVSSVSSTNDNKNNT